MNKYGYIGSTGMLLLATAVWLLFGVEPRIAYGAFCLVMGSILFLVSLL